MRRIEAICLAFMLMGNGFLFAQVSPDCTTAVPICNNTPINGGTNGYGSDDFNGAATSGCLERTLSGAIESNASWYRFRTNAAGQLGFNIGHDAAEDWDFALYLASDCNTLGDPIRCNFFDNSDGNSFIGVGEDPSGIPDSIQYEDWLDVVPGQDYYLLINNFSNINSGFSIQFSGQIFEDFPYDALDCSIISNLLGPPIAACNSDTVVLDATTPGAINYTWYEDQGAGFVEITGESNATLQVIDDAIYRVRVATASNTIISDVQVAFTESPIALAVNDAVFCYTPDMLFDLSQKDAETLGGQSPTEFLVSYHNSQAEAQTGSNPLPKSYPVTPGNETFFIRVTSLQNATCYDASQQFELYALEIPELLFEEDVTVCDGFNSVTIGETAPDPRYTYQWSTGASTPTITVSDPGNYVVTATHTFGGESCSSSRTVTVATSTLPGIAEVEIDDLQTNNQVRIITDIAGDFEYRLDDGPFQTSNAFDQVLPGAHTVTIRDILGCGEVTEDIVVVGFLNHFSPNGDGSNENWHIQGLEHLDDPVVTIYDRYGKLMQQLTTSHTGWDGTYNGQPVPATDYWFKLSYRNATGNRVNARYIQNHFSLRR